MAVFFVHWIGELVAASFCGFVWTPVAFSATQVEAVWMAYGRCIWSPSFSSKRIHSATVFLLYSHPRFYRSQSLSLLWCIGILSQRREKFSAIFICLFFWGVHFTAFGVLERVMNAVNVCIMSVNFRWSKKWYEFTSSNVFCLQAWHFRNLQIRASLCSPCHCIFRA